MSVVGTIILVIQWNHSIMDSTGTSETALHMEVYLIEMVSNAVMYYCETRTSVLNGEVINRTCYGFISFCQFSPRTVTGSHRRALVVYRIN